MEKGLPVSTSQTNIVIGYCGKLYYSKFDSINEINQLLKDKIYLRRNRPAEYPISINKTELKLKIF